MDNIAQFLRRCRIALDLRIRWRFTWRAAWEYAA